jgi:DNA (cytosine-5)-methyltransferase 1
VDGLKSILGGFSLKNITKEIIVDNFAGGGGASTGISVAIGRSVDIAINHDPAAIAMHKANHPDTEHYCESVWDIDPVKACKGRPVGLAWFSPDCKHFSKAKGGKPVEKKIRGLAWIVLKWAGKVRPRVIMLENVEEFVTWGPVRKGKPVKSKKGQTFEMWKSQLVSLGYKVEHRELRACDYGAPTSRKRFFLVARCDGKPIVWPKPTHGDPEKIEVRCGLMKPWRTAAECIDWSLPCPSIFDRKKPLAENTLRRIARGIQKFVIDNPKPFIVQVNYAGAKWDYCNPVEKPLATITAKHGFGLVSPVISQIGQTGGGDRLHDIQEPLSTIVSKAEHMLVAPTLIQYHSETAKAEHRGQNVKEPVMTLDGSNRYGLVTSHLLQMNNNCDGRSLNEPIPTIVAGPGHWGEVRTFLMSYYGSEKDLGQRLDEPLRTITSKDRFGIVTVHGRDYQIVDIGMRMLEPHELFAAQGFPKDYIINRDDTGKPYPKTAQVARCGNSVPPPFAEALTRANLPELCQGEREVAL